MIVTLSVASRSASDQGQSAGPDRPPALCPSPPPHSSHRAALLQSIAAEGARCDHGADAMTESRLERPSQAQFPDHAESETTEFRRVISHPAIPDHETRLDHGNATGRSSPTNLRDPQTGLTTETREGGPTGENLRIPETEVTKPPS